MTTTLRGIRRFVALLGALALVLALPGIALADGDETLGEPSIPIASGSGIASGGVGLEDTQPATFTVSVPAGATVNQVLLYWNGFAFGETGDDTITIEGNSVTGMLIGGPDFFFNTGLGPVYSSTYRADITDLGLVGDGTTTLTVGDLDFGRNDNGAGIMVIYDDGTMADLQLRDGNDLAYDGIQPAPFPPPRDTTVPQTFTFEAAAVDRDVTLTLFAASVNADGAPRPNSVEVTVDGVTTVFDTPFQSNVGPEFDVAELTVMVPAGATQLTVQALSNDPPGDPTGNPASFVWIGAGLVVPIPQDGGGEGCTPGYWKQDQHFDSWEPTGYSPDDLFETAFQVTSEDYDWTLLEALEAKGGGEKALARHAVAALLNASNPDVSYEYSTDEVIALVQDAYSTGDFEPAKDLLEYQNEMGCPLN